MTTPAPEPTPIPAGASLVGQTVSGRYLVHELLGEGGMGAVYLAEHTHMRKRVALKVLHPEMSQEPEVLARFRREAEAAAHVEHPNVAAATDFGQTEDGAFFLVLEYVEGTDLRKALSAGAFAPARALSIAAQIALALERAHGAGIVHRDLKPENVMLVRRDDDPDFVKVLDFGIAKVEPRSAHDSSQPLTRLGTILGTPEYMAPEQALGEAVGPGADLYALGVMLYEMLTGRHPFDTEDRMAVLSMHIVAPIPAMADRNPAIDVPPPIEAVTRRLLEKDAKLRPESARALVMEIEAAARAMGLELPVFGPGRYAARESRPDLGSPRPAHVASPSSPTWSRGDALAKTDYGVPAAHTPEPPAVAMTQRGGGTAHALAARAVEALQRLPRGPVIAVAAVFPVLVLAAVVTFIVVWRAPPGEGGAEGRPGAPVEQARAPRAPDAEREAAAAAGPSALEALADAYPEDPTVHTQLALALRAAERWDALLRLVPALVRLDAVDDEVVEAVAAAAQRDETADEAFAALEGPLGARGFDALLTMAKTKATPKAARSRAGESVKRPEVRANASPAASILLDFEAAKSCADKRALLDRVTEHGDARLLSRLRSMKRTRGCGVLRRGDCWPCLRRDGSLDVAIEAVAARAGG